MQNTVLHSVKTGLLYAALMLFAISFSLNHANAQDDAPPAPAAAAAADGVDYVLGTGDKLKIIVFGEDTLSGEFEISSTGLLSMPLIGNIKAAGQTVDAVQDSITKSLANGYLRDPRVSVAVLNYRPFFILGEVMKPGSYSYTNGMTIVNAIATAGGYTYRADKNDIQLKRGNDAEEVRVKEDAPVMPGDVVRVPERFF